MMPFSFSLLLLIILIIRLSVADEYLSGNGLNGTASADDTGHKLTIS